MNGITETISALTSSRIGLTVVCILSGVLAASAASSFVSGAVGAVVRALLSRGADAEENALSLSELGVEKNIFVRAALRRKKGLLSRLVRRVPGESGDSYYLPAENRKKAEAIYGDRKQNPVMLPVATILLGITAYALVRLLPGLIDLITTVWG